MLHYRPFYFPINESIHIINRFVWVPLTEPTIDLGIRVECSAEQCLFFCKHSAWKTCASLLLKAAVITFALQSSSAFQILSHSCQGMQCHRIHLATLLAVMIFCGIAHEIHTTTRQQISLVLEKDQEIFIRIDDSGLPSTTTISRFLSRYRVQYRKVTRLHVE